jgi:UDP-2,3-diacylglucosamine hydrolase
MTVFFVSDLHLDAARPEVTEAFRAFLAGEARDAEALYILGDLFELWIGPDPRDEHQRSVIDALAEYVRAGGNCLFTHGNRDFLIDKRFASQTGIQIQPPATVVSLYDEPALLLHGDELCTDDYAYQRMRSVLRSPGLQRVYWTLPESLRRMIAARIRGQSRIASRTKPPEILDVNQDAVRAAMREHQVRLLIHGHTHRPGIHEFELDGQPARRIVLGDWYEQASILRWTAAGPELEFRAYA